RMSLSHPEPVATIRGSTHRSEDRVGDAVAHGVESLARLGYVVRGIIYLVPGLLALRLALGRHGAAVTQTDTIAMIGHQPFGRALLIAVAVGLAGYALWGVLRAVLDTLRKGHSLAGVAKRLGFVTSALAYSGLLVVTLRYLAGSPPHVAKPSDWATGLL